MGMRVFFGGTAMRGPARVSDAVGAVERLEADDFFQVAKFAFSAADLQTGTVAGNRDSRRVVAAVLQLAKALNDYGNDLLLAHISHDAAHWLVGSLMNARWGPLAAPKGAFDFEEPSASLKRCFDTAATLRGRNETLQ